MVKTSEGYVVAFGHAWESTMSRLEHHREFIRRVLSRRLRVGRARARNILSGDQINEILEILVISGNIVSYKLHMIDLSNVPEDLLACLVFSSRELSISQTQLSTGQISAILHTIRNHFQLSIQDLEIRVENLKYVDTDIIADCQTKLKKCILNEFSHSS